MGSAAFRHSISLAAAPTTRSGVHARVRDDDEQTVVTDVHERDTLPPAPAGAAEFEDVHARETVNRKISPEFLAYLRSFDAGPAVVADPATPQPWSFGPRDDQPEIEVAESFDDEETLLALPAGALPAGVLPSCVLPSSLQPSFPDEQTNSDDRFHKPFAADEEIPSFRDGRAIACVVAVLSAVAGAVATVFVMY
jgi:hypothetical protein